MPIDPRLLALGFTPVKSNRPDRKRRLFISMEGPTGTGKTDFLKRCPPPQVCIDFDRGMEGVAEYDIWGNEIAHKFIDMPDLDQGGILPTQGELQIARASYTEFKLLMHQTFVALDAIGGGTLSVETGGAAYAVAQIARFGQIGKIGEVPIGAWDPMKAEFEGIFLEYTNYPGVNVVVSHRQGSKYGGMVGEKDLKGYKEMQHLAQVHLAFQKVYRRTPLGVVERNAAGVEQFDLVRKVIKCRQRLALMGAEFPVVFMDDEMRESIGGDFATIATAVFPDTTLADWFPEGTLS